MIFHVKRATKILSSADKKLFFHDLAFKAQLSASNLDFAASFKIIRSLSGYTPKPINSIKKKDGSFTLSENERQSRWQEHFAELYSGVIVDEPPVRGSHNQVHAPSAFAISVCQTAEGLARLG